MEKPPALIAQMAAQIFSGDNDYDEQDSVDIAEELFDRANGTYVEEPEEPEESEQPMPSIASDEAPSTKQDGSFFLTLLVWFIIVAIVVVTARVVYLRYKANHLNPTCSVIHRPTGGCPSGYVQGAKPSFLEKDGSQEFACYNAAKPACIDELKPGERYQFQRFLSTRKAIPTISRKSTKREAQTSCKEAKKKENEKPNV